MRHIVEGKGLKNLPTFLSSERSSQLVHNSLPSSKLDDFYPANYFVDLLPSLVADFHSLVVGYFKYFVDPGLDAQTYQDHSQYRPPDHPYFLYNQVKIKCQRKWS